MCGIAGVRKFGNTRITGEEIVLLLLGIEHRGGHATGVALVNSDGIQVCKAPEVAWKFVKTKEFDEFMQANLRDDTIMAILHTRFATTGSPERNENNHPIFDGQTAITHNGMISNHTWIFSNGNYKRSCETDSDIFRAIIDQHGFHEKGLREMCKLSGSAAIACVSSKHPGELLLARSGSPLTFAWNEEGSKLYWASELPVILRAQRPFYEYNGTYVQDTKATLRVGSMPDNTAWVFDEQGRMVLHHEFRVNTGGYVTPNYREKRYTYKDRRAQWKREAEEEKKKVHTTHPINPDSPGKAEIPSKDAEIACPKCGLIIINKFGRPWSKLFCPEKSCGTKLG